MVVVVEVVLVSKQVSKVYVDLYSASTQTPLTRSDMYHTVLLQTTQYLPLFAVAEHHRPLTGTHCAYPRKNGQDELTWVVC